MFARVLILLAAISAVFGFQLSSSRQSSSSLMMSAKSKSLPFLPQPANTVGYAGDVGFDPAGFSNIMSIKWLREAELKHCRIAMLAVAGIFATQIVHLPGAEHEVGFVAAHDAAVKTGAMQQILLWTSLFEIVSTKAVIQTVYEDSSRAPGEFGFDPLGFSKGNKDKYALNELKNGRLAMLAFSGLVTQAVLTGKEFPFAQY